MIYYFFKMIKAENFSFDAKISKLLKLMVHSIYTIIIEKHLTTLKYIY